MPQGKVMLLPNPEEFTPTVAQATGKNRATPMMASVHPMRNEAAFAPAQFIGTYPVYESDRSFMVWSDACTGTQ